MERPILEHGMQEIEYLVLIGASNRPREVFCKMICCKLSGNFLGYAGAVPLHDPVVFQTHFMPSI